MSPSGRASHDGSSRRAIGIVRVSRVGGRDGERFVSPDEQHARIKAVCERDGLTLIDVHDELDVSGGKPLAQRPGLNAAVEAVENGHAEVVAAAYFDRLFRSLATQAEVIDRVERAGGSVLAVDVGQVTNGSAGQWLSGTMMGAVSEYYRRSIRDRSREGQVRAVQRGAIPWARVPLGYVKRDDGTLTPASEAEVELVRRAFQMRADGRSAMRIRAMLRENGIERSPRGVQVMLSNRIYLGELHFGDLHNLTACEPIIDRAVFDRVQRMVIPRGPQPRSTRLLSRLGILRCGSCGARLGSMKLPRQNDYPIYRCPSTSDCDRHVMISAQIAEDVVVAAVRAALSDVEGRASMITEAREAAEAATAAQDALEAAIRSLTASGLLDEPAAVQRLSELRAARDDAQDRAARLSDSGGALTLNGDADWDRLSFDEQRALIQATVKRATVANGGRGASRVTVELAQ